MHQPLGISCTAAFPFLSLLVFALQALPVAGCTDDTCTEDVLDIPSDEAVTCTEDVLDFPADEAVNLLQKKAELRRAHPQTSVVPSASSDAAKPPAPAWTSESSRGGLSPFWQHLVHMVSAGAVCSESVSDSWNYFFALTIPSMMVVLFAAIAYWLSVAFPRPPASESLHNVTRIDAHGFPVSINWHFVIWTGLAIGMANVNYVVVLPIAVGNFSGSMWEAGLWVGLYAFGALISMPLFIALGHQYTRTAIVLHGLTTLIGNIIMVYGAVVQSITWLMIGRIATGLAFGIYYTCNHGCLYLIPTWDRLEAIFISRCVYSIGFALGPSISPLCNYVLTRQPWVSEYFPNYDAAAEGTPLVLMALYGFLYALGGLFVFKDVEILDAETEGLGVGASHGDPNQNNATWEEKKQAIIMFSSVVFTHFTRNLIRVMWETGTVIILAKVYCVATGAGIVVSIVAITVVFTRLAMAKLGIACSGDLALLMRVLEWGGVLSIPFMFLYGMKPGDFTLALFLCGGIIFYNANASQSGLLLALGGETAIPGHFWLDKVALNTYMYISMLVAYIFGPICTFVTQDLNPGQDTVAVLVAAVTVLQIIVTYSSVRPKSTDPTDTTSSFKNVKDKATAMDSPG